MFKDKSTPVILKLFPKAGEDAQTHVVLSAPPYNKAEDIPW